MRINHNIVVAIGLTVCNAASVYGQNYRPTARDITEAEIELQPPVAGADTILFDALHPVNHLRQVASRKPVLVVLKNVNPQLYEYRIEQSTFTPINEDAVVLAFFKAFNFPAVSGGAVDGVNFIGNIETPDQRCVADTFGSALARAQLLHKWGQLQPRLSELSESSREAADTSRSPHTPAALIYAWAKVLVRGLDDASNDLNSIIELRSKVTLRDEARLAIRQDTSRSCRRVLELFDQRIPEIWKNVDASRREISEQLPLLRAIVNSPEQFRKTEFVQIGSGPGTIDVTVSRRAVKAGDEQPGRSNSARRQSSTTSGEGQRSDSATAARATNNTAADPPFIRVAQGRINVGHGPRLRLGLGLMYAGLESRSYGIAPRPTSSPTPPGDTTHSVITLQDSSTSQISPMMFLSTRITPELTLPGILRPLSPTAGLALGLGVETTGGKVSGAYFGGFDLSWFDERLHVLLGEYFAPQKRLAQGYAVGSGIPEKATVPTTTRLGRHFGIGIAYGISIGRSSGGSQSSSGNAGGSGNNSSRNSSSGSGAGAGSQSSSSAPKPPGGTE